MTAGRADSLLQAAGVKETVLGSLERGDSLFVLTDDTLLFQDSGGIRRVTLRDLRRIHSDESGLLRVETPAGTALTSSLLGFDPAAVQSFFRQVKEATAKAKERAGTTTIITEPAPVSRPAATQPAAPTPGATWTPPVTPAPLPPRTSGVSAAPAPTALVTPSTPETFRPAGPVTAQPSTQATQPSPVPPPASPRPAAAPLGTPAINPVPAVSPAPAAAPAPSRPLASAEPRVPASEAPKTTVKAVRTPTVITDPAVARPDEKFTAPVTRSEPDGRAAEKSASALAPVAAEHPAVSAGRVALPGGAAGALSALAAVAGGVSAWAGRLKFLSVVMLLAALALAYLQFDQGMGLNGVWVLIAGGMSAVGLWALGDIAKLLVSLAQAVSAEGGVMDVD